MRARPYKGSRASVKHRKKPQRVGDLNTALKKLQPCVRNPTHRSISTLVDLCTAGWAHCVPSFQPGGNEPFNCILRALLAKHLATLARTSNEAQRYQQSPSTWQ
eukprot:5886536-Amphidinium_carterae.2